MKIFNQIRYVLFGLMVLGAFANFAQNEYGWTIIYTAEFLIGLTFLVESFLWLKNYEQLSKGKVFYFFYDNFWLGILFIGYSLWFNGASPIPRMTILLSLFFLTIQYLIFAIRVVIKEFGKGTLQAIIVSLFSLTTILSVIALSWKINRWGGTSILMISSIYAIAFITLLVIIKRKYNYKGERITIKDRFKIIPGNMLLVFCYFSIWIIYFALIPLGIVPGFYTLSNPPAAEQLKQTNHSSRADAYYGNYSNFLENRRIAEEK